MNTRHASASRASWCTAAGLLVLAGVSATVHAHPAVGIVAARDGTVFYSDTVHVWAIAPDGTRSIAVRNVHTHELRLDADGSLYGEHLAYDSGQWSHRIWKRWRSGEVTDVIPTRQGFLTDVNDFGFHVDGRGTLYWLEGASPVRLRARQPGGAPRTRATLDVRNHSWLAVSADGTAFVSEGGVVWRVPPDRPAERLTAALSRSRERLAVMGMAATADGTLYVAAYFDRAVRRLAPDGGLATVATTPEGWGPTGVTVATDGVLWVLEASDTNAQRVRRVGRDGQVRVYD